MGGKKRYFVVVGCLVILAIVLTITFTKYHDSDEQEEASAWKSFVIWVSSHIKFAGLAQR